MRVLITGGAGFIGSHLAQALAAEGADIRVFDNLSTGSKENLAGIPHQFVVGDVADFAAVLAAARGCDLIFHQAALVSVPLSIANPLLNQQSNIEGNSHVFEAARQAGVRRVVYASSAAVYGNAPGLPKRESDAPNILTPYAAGKLLSEILAAAYRHTYGLEAVGLRYMNVFGPRQDPGSPYSGVLSIFCRAALGDGQVTVFGDGEQTRDFVYVSDVVDANLQAANLSLERLNGHLVFNVGRGEQTSLNQVLAILEDICGQRLMVTYNQPREGDIRHSVADISASQAGLGYQPAVSVQEGLKYTLDWLRQKN